MINVTYTRTFEISLLGEKYNLTEEEFRALQPECREIADFVVDPVEPEDRTETDLPDEPEINSAPIEAAEIIKPLDEVVLSKMETTTKPELTVPVPMDTKILTDRIDKMQPYRSRKGIDPYVKMHEEGKPMEAIKNQMLADNFCPQGSLSYHIKKVLAASTRVTKIELESAVETAEQTIERLKAENLANTEKRKQPKIAIK